MGLGPGGPWSQIGARSRTPSSLVTVIVIVIVIVCLVEDAGSLQQWGQQPTYTEANPGEGVVLPCVIHNIQVRRLEKNKLFFTLATYCTSALSIVFQQLFMVDSSCVWLEYSHQTQRNILDTDQYKKMSINQEKRTC